MMQTITPRNERDEETLRLQALEALHILDTPPEAAFDDLAWLAGRMCEAPISLVSLVDAERLWFKARLGFDLEAMPRRDTFCSHALAQDDILEIPDARLDARFEHLPPVTGEPRVRFYAGAVLLGPGGHRYGTLCVLDTRPRRLSEDQREALRRLARRVSESLEMRRQNLFARSREAAIASLLDVLPDGVVTCDAAGALKEFNAVSREWHGVDARVCAPEEWASHFGLYDEQGQRMLQPSEIPLARAWKGERVRGQTIVIRTPDRPPRTVSCNANPLLDADCKTLGAVCTMHDVTAQIELAQLMERLALTDGLTGLPNRMAWAAALDQAVAWGRHAGRTVVVMFIDLDGFKQINDAFGHTAGDEVLRQFSQRLRDTCGADDFIARLAGDEFVVCARRLGDRPVDLDAMARRLHEAVAPAIAWERRELRIGCSIGFAVGHGPDIQASRLMERADQAMYVAKRDKSLTFSTTQTSPAGDVIS